jgi:hypothetical protein
MIEALFQTFAFDSLPLFVVRVTQKYGVLGGYYRRPLRQWYHLTLHYLLDGAGDLYYEFLGLAARFYLRISCRFFQNKLGGFAVYPPSDFFKNAQFPIL